jgi:hypothetical protein
MLSRRVRREVDLSQVTLEDFSHICLALNIPSQQIALYYEMKQK